MCAHSLYKMTACKGELYFWDPTHPKGTSCYRLKALFFALEISFEGRFFCSNIDGQKQGTSVRIVFVHGYALGASFCHRRRLLILGMDARNPL